MSRGNADAAVGTCEAKIVGHDPMTQRYARMEHAGDSAMVSSRSRIDRDISVYRPPLSLTSFYHLLYQA
jgi:hypothetical protein